MKMQGCSYISGFGAYLPQTVVHSDELMQQANSRKFGLPYDFMSRKIGIVERRYAIDESFIDLAYEASKCAIEDANLSPLDIDLIIYCGISGQYKEPSTAHEIQNKIGAKNAICFDSSNACLGIVTSIMTANAFIQSGAANHVLLCTAERGSDVARLALKKIQQANDKQTFKSYLGGLTVGDAGGALLVSKNDRDDTGLIRIRSASEGQYAKLCYFNDSVLHGVYGAMHMAEISAKALALHKHVVAETYDLLDWEPSDISGVYAHQFGKQPHIETSKIVRLPLAKCFTTYDLYGNLASATIPVNMHLYRPEKGKKYLLFGAASGISICHVGFIF